jgi:hypothetical protein
MCSRREWSSKKPLLVEPARDCGVAQIGRLAILINYTRYCPDLPKLFFKTA